MIGHLYGQEHQESSNHADLNQESIEIRTDRDLYVTGEILWFKLISIYFVSDGEDASGFKLSIFGKPIFTLTYNLR